MSAILELLKRLNPGLEKTTLYRLLEYVVLAVLLVGLWNDASESLSHAKAARDEQIKGYAVQIGVLHAENEAQKMTLKVFGSGTRHSQIVSIA